jgi:hypothetical protein
MKITHRQMVVVHEAYIYDVNNAESYAVIHGMRREKERWRDQAETRRYG